MPRRIFELTVADFTARIVGRQDVTTLALGLDHRLGTVQVIVEDPSSAPLPPGCEPPVERL